MNIEAQENRIRSMLEEVATDPSDESSSEEETDHCSEHNVNSGTEQEADDDPMDVSSNSGQENVVANETYDDSDDDVPLSVVRSRISSENIIMSASYNVSRNSKRWPMTLFYGILNMAAINAYIIYEANKSSIKRTEFIRNLGLSLIYKHLQTRKEKKNIPVHIRQKISSQLDDPTPGPSANVSGRYVRCSECPNKKDRKTKYCCNTCAKPISMEHAKFLCESCADIN